MMRSAIAALALAAVAAAAPADPKDPAPAKPDCLVSDATASAGPAPATAPPEETRRAIFTDLEAAVQRAQREAAAAYPNAESGSLLSPTNVQKDTKLAGKRTAMQRSLERSYLADVLKRRQLTCASARNLYAAGLAAGWRASK